MSIIYLLVALVLSITLHEFAHAWVGFQLGDPTAQQRGRLTLNPFAHIDPLTTLLLPVFLILAHSPIIFGAAKPVPFNPWAVRGGKWGAVAVALAGPFTNLLLALFFGLWLRFVPGTGAGSTLLFSIAAVNAAFGFFNLVPFPPLDGSRLLYALAPMPVRDVMDKIERAGIAAILLFMFVFYPFIAPIVGSLVSGYLGLIIPGAGV